MKLQRIIDNIFNDGKKAEMDDRSNKVLSTTGPKCEEIHFTSLAQQPTDRKFEWNLVSGIPSYAMCSKCYTPGADVSLIGCNHRFHMSCILDPRLYRDKCPICIEFATRMPCNMPPGKMTIIRSSTLTNSALGTIVIQYFFPEGTLRGQKYRWEFRTTFLPDNHDGNKLLKRWKYAFRNGMTFAVYNNAIVCQFSSHKTSMSTFANSALMHVANIELDVKGVPAAENL